MILKKANRSILSFCWFTFKAERVQFLFCGFAFHQTFFGTLLSKLVLQTMIKLRKTDAGLLEFSG